MATTNYRVIPILQASMPHTFNSLQALVIAMAKFQKNKGKKTLFGRDKGREAWEMFEQELKKTMASMFLDDLIERNAPVDSIREKLVECIMEFSAVFPNWQDAYEFAIEFLVHDRSKANDVVGALRT